MSAAVTSANQIRLRLAVCTLLASAYGLQSAAGGPEAGPLRLPVAIVEADSELPEPLLPAAVRYEAAGRSSLPAYVVLDASYTLDRLPRGARMCRLPHGLSAAEACRQALEIRRQQPQSLPVIPLTRPFEILRVPAGVLLEVPEAAAPEAGWFLYRHYLVLTHGVRFVVPQLSESEILLGAAAGSLPERLRAADKQRDLARLYSLLWLPGGYSHAGVGEGALLLLPPEGAWSAQALGVLAGFHAALLEAGIAPRLLRSDEVSAVDIARYRLLLVAESAGMSQAALEAIEEAVQAGGMLATAVDKGMLLRLAGVSAGATESSAPMRFNTTEPPLPQISGDGLARRSRCLRADDCQVLLGSRDGPLVTLRRVGAGWVLLLNLDFADYRRLTDVGFSGGEQVRELLRWAAARAGVPAAAGAPAHAVPGTAGGAQAGKSRQAARFQRLAATCPAGALAADWFSLSFFWRAAGDERGCMTAPADNRIFRRAYESPEIVVEGSFSRRLEWLTASIQPAGNRLRLATSGLPAGAALPLLLDIQQAGEPAARSLYPVMYNTVGAGAALPAAAGIRVLLEDLLFGFRALAVAY